MWICEESKLIFVDVGTNSPEVLKSEFQQVVGSQDKSPEKEQFHVDQGAGITQNIFRVLE